MSITDELRKYISGTARCGISPICEKSLANIAEYAAKLRLAEREDA